MIRGLILDMDGTLLDSHDTHLEAWKNLLKNYNITKTDSEILSHFGKTTEDIAKNLFPKEYDPVRIGREKDEIFLSLISNIRLFAGVFKVLSRLKQQNYRICIASSNPRRTIQAICTNCKLNVDAFVGIEDITHGKPAPDMILAAAAHLKIPISDCLTVGDSIYDIKAAQAANCKVVAVLTGTQPLKLLKKERPDFILPSITEIESILKALS